jgi:hypothetical protein
MRIAYLPAYYRDLGAVSSVGWAVDQGHPGDSEYMVVDLIYDQHHWQTNGVFLSAHCGSQVGPFSTNPYCKGYGYDALEFVDGVYRGAPVVYVADGTNANYPSVALCDGGTYYLDSCAASSPTRFPVSFDFNIGSSTSNPGRVTARRTPNIGITDPNRVECIWCLYTPFGGWQQDGDATDTTPYGAILDRFASPGYGGGDPCLNNPYPYYRAAPAQRLLVRRVPSSSAAAAPLEARRTPTSTRAPPGISQMVVYNPCP